MTETLRILGIPACLRRSSYNRGLLRAAQEVTPVEVVIEVYQELARIPPYNADVEAVSNPAPVRRLKDRIRGSNALLIATPE